ncbi:MAG: rhomboid family intramembrane serine protease [Desulfomonilaceae bacterium]|nr:rhomboid family intramembrane serine protease [Desulfomonilaceae bacterium]
MIPLRDSTRSETVPYVTVALIILNGVVWLYEVALGPHVERYIFEYGLIPLKFMNYSEHPGGFLANALIPLFSSIFMHAGWMHVIGNMWFLWIFGDNIEDRLGHLGYLVFYLVCGIGASLIHVVFHPTSTLPMVGASGAISGVLGAYLISFPHARVHTLLIIFVLIRFVEIPAFVFLIVWFLFQFLASTAGAGAQQDVGGVAYWAHMGGFVVGIVVLFLMPKRKGAGPPRHDDGFRFRM